MQNNAGGAGDDPDVICLNVFSQFRERYRELADDLYAEFKAANKTLETLPAPLFLCTETNRKQGQFCHNEMDFWAFSPNIKGIVRRNTKISHYALAKPQPSGGGGGGDGVPVAKRQKVAKGASVRRCVIPFANDADINRFMNVMRSGRFYLNKGDIIRFISVCEALGIDFIVKACCEYLMTATDDGSTAALDNILLSPTLKLLSENENEFVNRLLVRAKDNLVRAVDNRSTALDILLSPDVPSLSDGEFVNRLLTRAKDCIRRPPNLATLWQEPRFREISKRLLCEILNDDAVISTTGCRDNEDKIAELVMRWYNAQEEQTYALLSSLFLVDPDGVRPPVRIAFLTTRAFVELVLRPILLAPETCTAEEKARARDAAAEVTEYRESWPYLAPPVEQKAFFDNHMRARWVAEAAGYYGGGDDDSDDDDDDDDDVIALADPDDDDMFV